MLDSWVLNYSVFGEIVLCTKQGGKNRNLWLYILLGLGMDVLYVAFYKKN